MGKYEVSPDELWPVLTVEDAEPGGYEVVDIPDSLVKRYRKAEDNWYSAAKAIRDHLASTGQKGI